MIKTALSASLIALAVLAPAASAAPEPSPSRSRSRRPHVLDAKTARYCAELAAVKPDKKGIVTLTKEQLAFQSKFDCPGERPADCPDEAKQEKLDKAVREYIMDRQRSHKAEWPEWLKQPTGRSARSRSRARPSRSRPRRSTRASPAATSSQVNS